MMLCVNTHLAHFLHLCIFNGHVNHGGVVRGGVEEHEDLVHLHIHVNMMFCVNTYLVHIFTFVYIQWTFHSMYGVVRPGVEKEYDLVRV